MLVLNRRPGESIVIEDGIEVSVVSVVDRKVWLSVSAPGLDPAVRVSASVVSDDEARLEIGTPVSVVIGADAVVVRVADAGHPSQSWAPTLALNRRLGESVVVGDRVRIGVGAVVKGSPSLSLEGPSIGTGVRITVLRPMGSYVRIGVDAPGRSVYRKELVAERAAAEAVHAPPGDHAPAGD